MTYCLLLPLLCLVLGCSTTNNSSQNESLWIDYGNPDADTFVILVQDGPVTRLDADIVDDIFLKSYLLDKQAIRILHVHQSQTRYPDKFRLFEFGFEDAKIFCQESVGLLSQIVERSLKMDKKIYVIGISYGAFLVQELLLKQGNVANGYLLVAGRLDLEEAAWRTLSDGVSVCYENGEFIQPILQDFGIDDMSTALKANMNKLLAGISFNRYTEKLRGVMMDNLIYAYNRFDERVGRLSNNEIDFLKSVNAKVYAWEAGENHSEFIEETLYLCIEEMLGLRSTHEMWIIK